MITLLCKLASQWEKVEGALVAGAEGFINQKAFFEGIKEISILYNESEFLPSKQANELVSFVTENLPILDYFFTGRLFCKGLGIFVPLEECQEAYKNLLEQYFKKRENSLMMFDELERQVIKSSIAKGALVLTLDHEVWFS